MPRFGNGGAGPVARRRARRDRPRPLGWLAPHGEPGATSIWRRWSAMVYGGLLAAWSAPEGRDARPPRRRPASCLSRTDRDGRRSRRPARPNRSAVRRCHERSRSTPSGCGVAIFSGAGCSNAILVADRPDFLKALCDAACARDRSHRPSSACAWGARTTGPTSFAGPRFICVEMRAHRSCAGKGIVMAILRDMTPTMEAREALEAAREASERANLWKDRFLANVSHELRTPLNAIIGFSEMLGNPAADARKTRAGSANMPISSMFPASICSASVNMILDMSKIEAGNFEIEPEPFDFAELVDFCCDVVKLKARRQENRADPRLRPQLDEIVADKRACKQILINLLSNAMKFTPERGKVVLVRPRRRRLHRNRRVRHRNRRRPRTTCRGLAIPSSRRGRPMIGLTRARASACRSCADWSGCTAAPSLSKARRAKAPARPCGCRSIAATAPKSAGQPAKIETMAQRGRSSDAGACPPQDAGEEKCVRSPPHPISISSPSTRAPPGRRRRGKGRSEKAVDGAGLVERDVALPHAGARGAAMWGLLA